MKCDTQIPTVNPVSGLRSNALLFLILTFLLWLCGCANVFGQETLRSRLSLDYEKMFDGTKMLSSKLNVRQGKKYSGLPGTEVSFYTFSGSDEVLLGSVFTDETGVAKFYIDKNYQTPSNKGGYTQYLVRFYGNDSIQNSDRSKKIKDCDLIISFEEKPVAEEGYTKDSVDRIVSIKLIQFDTAQRPTPVENERLSIYVTRLYGLMLIQQGKTNEKGRFEYILEKEIPGDTLGNIQVVVRIEDSEDFGYVTQAKTIDWGEVVHYHFKAPRALWSEQAPLWMVISVTIVLGGAWFHFIIVIWHLYKCFTYKDMTQRIK